MNKQNALNLSPKGSFDDLVANLREELGFLSISHEEEKARIGQEVSSFAKDGDRIGLGSGSTSFLAAIALARRVSILSMRVTIVPTSHEIAHLAASLGLSIGELTGGQLDWCFDGADEVDGRGRLLKGRGGALLREKIVIANSKKAYILVDPSKKVSRLGERFPVPVEVLPEAVYPAASSLFKLGATEVVLRKAGISKDGPLITEHGAFILDARFPEIPDSLERDIKCIPGVLESGFFPHYPQIQIIGLD